MSLGALKARGINAASITYDSRDVLQRFAGAYNIEYPMLSDEGSKVIRAFRILNTNIPEDHPMLYGIPFPGDYLIAPNGTVRDKLFLPSYEHRPSASQIAMRQATDAEPNSVQIKTDVLSAKISLSADRCFPGQELGVALDVHLEPGWHVYGDPLPKNYQAIALQFEGPLVGEYSMKMPAARPILLKALNETLPVYEDELHAMGKLGIRWSPPIPAKFLEPLGPPIKPGLHQIDGAFRFQACSDDVCEMPQTIKFQLALTIESGIPAPPKKSP
jgi:AhpC/TSA family/Disulphide bond corrector protein DsbC